MNWMTRRFEGLDDQEMMSFVGVKNIKDNGVYIVYKDKKAIYVGSTTTEGHRRIGDLDNHYSNHTLHKKILKEYWNISQKPDKVLKNKCARNPKQYKIKDKDVKDLIINALKYKFSQMKKVMPENIKRFEHFCIACLNTTAPQKYND